MAVNSLRPFAVEITMNKQAAQAEFDALLKSTKHREPTPSEQKRAQELIKIINADDWLVKDIEEALQLVDSAESPSRPLSPQERGYLAAYLTAAGDHKVGLFSAMRHLAKEA